MYTSKMQRVSDKWAAATDFSHTFFGYPPLQAYLRTRITGQADEWEYTYLLRELVGDGLPVPRALSIFCGHGELEIELAKQGTFEHCLALDISEGALAHARQSAAAANVTSIEFKRQDMNLPNALPEHEFDLVIANGALHHAMTLTQLLTQLKGAMKPGALLLSSEYVGPDHYGKTFRQQQMITTMQDLVPLNLQRAVWQRMEMKSRFKALIRQWIHRMASRSKFAFRILNNVQMRRLERKDPSEAVHSSDVIGVMKSVFPNVEVRPFGGALLASAISPHLMDVLDLSNPDHCALLEVFIQIEQIAETFGDVDSANAFLIAWN